MITRLRLMFWYTVHDVLQWLWQWVWYKRVAPLLTAERLYPLRGLTYTKVGMIPATEKERAVGITHKELYVREGHYDDTTQR